MGIYLGSNDLLGGGGTIPIGGIKYFIPPSGTTFTSGQEVYTDPDDSTVWIRSGAKLTGAGSGALDASVYQDAVGSLQDTGTDVTVGAGLSSVANRYQYAYLGQGIIATGGNQNNYISQFQLTDASTRTTLVGPLSYNFGLFDGNNSGSSNGASSDGSVTTQGFSLKGAAANATHIFSADNSASGNWQWTSIGGSGSTPTRFRARYISQSVLSSSTTAADFLDRSSTFMVPSEFTGVNTYRVDRATDPSLYMAITGVGLTDDDGNSLERHWFMDGKEGIARQYTFDATTANDGEPWTATGISINFLTAVSGFQLTNRDYNTTFFGNGEILYLNSETTQYEFNGTTGAVIRTFTGLALQEVIAVPSTETMSGNTEFWFYDQGSGGVAHIHTETEILTAPYIGAYAGTRNPIVLTDSAGTAASDGQSAAEEDIYLWMRIA